MFDYSALSDSKYFAFPVQYLLDRVFQFLHNKVEVVPKSTEKLSHTMNMEHAGETLLTDVCALRMKFTG
jgi:hypothetical protein